MNISQIKMRSFSQNSQYDQFSSINQPQSQQKDTHVNSISQMDMQIITNELQNQNLCLQQDEKNKQKQFNHKGFKLKSFGESNKITFQNLQILTDSSETKKDLLISQQQISQSSENVYQKFYIDKLSLENLALNEENQKLKQDVITMKIELINKYDLMNQNNDKLCQKIEQENHQAINEMKTHYENQIKQLKQQLKNQENEQTEIKNNLQQKIQSQQDTILKTEKQKQEILDKNLTHIQNRLDGSLRKQSPPVYSNQCSMQKEFSLQNQIKTPSMSQQQRGGKVMPSVSQQIDSNLESDNYKLRQRNLSIQCGLDKSEKLKKIQKLNQTQTCKYQQIDSPVRQSFKKELFQLIDLNSILDGQQYIIQKIPTQKKYKENQSNEKDIKKSKSQNKSSVMSKIKLFKRKNLINSNQILFSGNNQTTKNKNANSKKLQLIRI